MSTAEHLKTMAAATHLERSEQGNDVPVLRLEIRYFDSHVRVRAIGEDGTYTDSIGANDLAEAVLLIGQVTRFGETMNARNLRRGSRADVKARRTSGNSTKRVVGLDDVERALQIREGGGSWAQVIEATGFNGATLRPHINRYLQSAARLNRPAVQKGDRTDSPHAVVQPVELTQESIVAARKSGMAWYSIAQALGVSEAKVKSLAGPEGTSRVYAPTPRRGSA